MKVVVLAGGRGTRLGLPDIPKPMVPVAGRPLLERLVEIGRRSGFEDFVFLNGYLGDVIERHFGDGSSFGVHIEHVTEEKPAGTAGAVLNARHLLDEPFVVLYGDVLIDVDLAHMVEHHGLSGADATVLVHPNSHPFDSDLVEVDPDGMVVALHPKPHPSVGLRQNLVSGALYVLGPQCLADVPANRTSDWAHDVFPAMLRGGSRISGYRSLEYAKDVGTPSRLAAAERDLASGRLDRLSRRNPKPAVFIDRDGVLNREIDGVYRPEDLEPLDGADRAVRDLNDAGVPAICVTNQPGVAKGFVDDANLRRVFAALDSYLADAGAYLDDVMICPHHPEKGWPGEISELKVECQCRKPAPGMLLEAAARHNLNLGRSWMVGDRLSDVHAARAAGCGSVLISDRDELGNTVTDDLAPDFVATSLPEAVRHILKVMS